MARITSIRERPKTSTRLSKRSSILCNETPPSKLCNPLNGTYPKPSLGFLKLLRRSRKARKPVEKNNAESAGSHHLGTGALALRRERSVFVNCPFDPKFRPPSMRSCSLRSVADSCLALQSNRVTSPYPVWNGSSDRFAPPNIRFTISHAAKEKETQIWLGSICLSSSE